MKSFGGRSTHKLLIGRLFVALLVVALVAGCQRKQRPFAGDDKIPADAPAYTVKANPNGGVTPQ